MKEREVASEEGAELEGRTDMVPIKPGTVDGGESQDDLSNDEQRAIEERLRYLGYID